MSKIEFTETKKLRNVDRGTRVIKLVKFTKVICSAGNQLI